MVIETRHTETGNHVDVPSITLNIWPNIYKKIKNIDLLLDDETIELLFRSSPLHDVGKVGVPDEILKFPAS